MQAIFRFNSAEEIEVWNDTSVNIFQRRGIEQNPDGSRYVTEEHTLSLSKSQARALASALMGAAAEL